MGRSVAGLEAAEEEEGFKGEEKGEAGRECVCVRERVESKRALCMYSCGNSTKSLQQTANVLS